MDRLMVVALFGLVSLSIAVPLEPCTSACRKLCEFGFLDEGSCPRCTCAPDPCKDKKCEGTAVCAVLRKDDCGYGACAAVGECMGTGLIVDPVSLPLPKPCTSACRKLCEFGFLDEGSCPRCTCAPDPCKDKKCEGTAVCAVLRKDDCGYGACAAVGECMGTGLIVDPVSLPLPKPCTSACRKLCEFGFLDEGSCPRCTCAPDPCKDKKCEGTSVCAVLHKDDCGYGACAAVGECMGTGLIDPVSLPLPEPCTSACRKLCEFGFLDEGSCPRCTCAPDPCKDKKCEGTSVCAVLRKDDCGYGACAAVGECRGTGLVLPVTIPGKGEPCEATGKKNCPFGFKTKGCPRRKCAKDPCKRKKCGKKAVCKSQPSECGFKSGCAHKAICVR